MAKSTFLNLKEEKLDYIIKSLVDIFYDTHVSKVTVSEIVEALDISRGSFYKYFEDIYDAYYTTAETCADKVHINIMKFIMAYEHDFLSGIKQFLIWCVDLDKMSYDWKIIQMLSLSNASVYAKRMKVTEDLLESKMVKKWLILLQKNDFHFDSNVEALYFLFHIEHIVITSIQDYVVNDWSKSELLKDFLYKKKWIEYGVKK